MTEVLDKTLNRRLDEILKNSLIGIYMDCPEIIEALHRVDFSRVNFHFKSELFKRMTPEEFRAVDDFLRSDAYLKYKNALDKSAMACSEELANLIYFVSPGQEGEVH